MHRLSRRHPLRVALLVVGLVGVVVAIAQVGGVASDGDRPGTALVVDGETHERWLVQAPSATPGELELAAAELGGGDAGERVAGGWYEVALADEVPAAAAEAAFEDVDAQQVEPVMPRVPYLEPDAIDDPVDGIGAPTVTARQGPQDAARIAEQWSLEQANDQDIDAPDAWRLSTGVGAVVAVIDTGVDASHPDLRGQVLPGRDFSGSTTGPLVDRVGHGTAVASVIAANAGQIAGVAPNAKILPLKVFRDSAAGFSMSGYLAAIRYAADQNVDAINISLGCGGSTTCYSQAERDALAYAARRGVVIVAAAGNGDSAGRGMNNDAPATPDYPSGYELPQMLAVTSSARSGAWSTWSNFGARTVDLAAPGEGILAAAPGGRYRSVSGTSFAAPAAAGTVALVTSQLPYLAPDAVVARILDAAVAHPTLQRRTLTGAGLNAHRAVTGQSDPDVAGGGPTTEPQPLEPASGGVVASPPRLEWALPSGWTSRTVQLRGPGVSITLNVPPSARSVAHPAQAWRSGTYVWQVRARRGDGVLVTGAARSYRLAPRLEAQVASGRIQRGGRTLQLRIAYAATEPVARVRVTVRAAGRTIHAGRWQSRSAHARSSASPRRASFAYGAALQRSLRVGQQVNIEVQVSAGGRTLTRRYDARVV